MWEDVRRCEDEKMRRWEDEKMWRWEDVKMRRCEDVKMRRCEDEKMWRWEDVKMRGCEDERMWRWEDVKMRRCEDERMWRWEDVKMRRCEDEKMWRWEDVKMRGCEDEKMWRWEDVLQTPTIGRTLRSDALGNKNKSVVPAPSRQAPIGTSLRAPWSVKFCEHLWNVWNPHRFELCEVPPLDAAKVNFDDRSFILSEWWGWIPWCGIWICNCTLLSNGDVCASA